MPDPFHLIRPVPDFPKAGILFRDITPMLEDARGFAVLIEGFVARYKAAKIDKVVGIESRGFILGAPLAIALGVGFVILRKPGKLPRPTRKKAYALEYGEGELHMHEDALKKGERVVVVDDVIATGGSLGAAVHLVRESGAELVELAVAIELVALQGRAALAPTPLFSLVSY